MVVARAERCSSSDSISESRICSLRQLVLSTSNTWGKRAPADIFDQQRFFVRGSRTIFGIK